MRTSALLPMAASAAATLIAERQASPEPTLAPTLAIPSIDAKCQSAIETILPQLADAPLPDPTLLPFIAGQEWATMTDLCSPPKVTGDPSMVAGWSSYMSSVSSFYSEHTSEISALAAACTGDASVAEQFPYTPGQCGAGGDGKGEGSGAGSQGGSGGGSGGNGNSNGDNGNQGASAQREVYLMAAMALVGMVFVGVY